MGTPCKIALILRVPMYSFWKETALVANMLPASASVASIMTYIAFDVLAQFGGS